MWRTYDVGGEDKDLRVILRARETAPRPFLSPLFISGARRRSMLVSLSLAAPPFVYPALSRREGSKRSREWPKATLALTEEKEVGKHCLV
jgi:hypothetical protein